MLGGVILFCPLDFNVQSPILANCGCDVLSVREHNFPHVAPNVSCTFSARNTQQTVSAEPGLKGGSNY